MASDTLSCRTRHYRHRLKRRTGALVLFVDEKKVRGEELPARYAMVHIIVERAGQIKAYAAAQWMNA
jgi:hypothetical protein